MSKPKSSSFSVTSQSSREEYDFLFRRPSAVRASQFEEAILAIAAATSEIEFKLATSQGIHSALQNVLKAEVLLFVHNDLKYMSVDGHIKQLAKTGILWKVMRRRTAEVFKNVPSDDPVFDILGLTQEDIEDRFVLVESISNMNEMRTVALLIAVCDDPTAEQREKCDWLAKNVQVAAGRIIECSKQEGDIMRMEGMLKLSGSLIDLDVHSLLIKMHIHIKHLIECEACTILILDEHNNELVCEVFDESPLDQEIRLSVAECIYGRSIISGEVVQIDDVSKDHQINPNTDFINNYEPNNMLFIPLKSRKSSIHDLSIVGVAAVFNKADGFTSRSLDDLQYVLKFCSTMIMNTLNFRHEIALRQQNQSLLNVSKNLFTRLNDRDKLLQSIMEEARNLTKAEKCSLFLVNKERHDLVAVVFDSELPSEDDTKGTALRIPFGQGIAGFVAQSGQTVNIRDAYKNPHFYREVDKTTGFVTRNLLCFPIIDDTGVVGVAQLVNKKGGRFFTNYDEELAKSFSVYCGISLHHSMLYKNVLMEQSRSQLATELMLYHMQVNDDEVVLLSKTIIPPCDQWSPRIAELIYSPRSIPDNDTTLCVISMMSDMDLIKRWKISRNTLARFVLMVKRGYRNPPYHNWMHAFSVAHFSYTLFKNCSNLQLLSEIEVLALFVSCLSHDIDHRGTNNAFQVSSKSVLASLYSSEGSVMERHHFSQTMCILNCKGCNIFENLTSEEYREILDLIYDIILATDLSIHLSIMDQLETMAKEGYDRTKPGHHHLLRSLLMTSCDLCACLKDWEMTVAVSKLIYTEFFSQGDQEKAIGMTPNVMMDREKAILSEQQLTFLDKIALPVYKTLSQVIPEASPAYQNLLSNREKWQKWN